MLGNGKKMLIVPLVAFVMCAAAFAGIVYALENPTVSSNDNPVSGKGSKIDFYSTDATVTDLSEGIAVQFNDGVVLYHEEITIDQTPARTATWAVDEQTITLNDDAFHLGFYTELTGKKAQVSVTIAVTDASNAITVTSYKCSVAGAAALSSNTGTIALGDWASGNNKTVQITLDIEAGSGNFATASALSTALSGVTIDVTFTATIVDA